MIDPIICIECGDKPCICSDEISAEILWAAHCQGCDNTTGKIGYYNPIHKTEEEAIEAWNDLNTGAFNL